MTSRAMRLISAKELRALLPLWGASAVIIFVAAVVAPDRRSFDLLMPAAFLAYTIGTSALGALAAGQDYLFGTVPSALSIPVDRRKILALKLLVLVPLVLSLAAAFTWALWRTSMSRGFDGPDFTVAIAAATVCLAPWLTIITRNLIAGTLFPLAMTSMSMIGADLVAGYGYGLWRGPAADALQTSLFKWTITIACVAGALLSWRAFTHMEATEGGSSAIYLGWRTRRAATADVRSQPKPFAGRAWLLVAKELHLQQLSFTVAALFTLGWLVLSVVYLRSIALSDFPTGGIALLVFASLSLLIGCISSAEERQLGVLPSQALLPMPLGTQYAIKVAVTMAVSLALALALPTILLYNGRGPKPLPFLTVLGSAVVVLTAIGLYVSSLASSGVRAIAWAVGALFALFWYGRWVSSLGFVRAAQVREPSEFLPLYWALAIAGLLVVLAYRNHGVLQPTTARVVSQIAAIAIFMPASLILLALL